MSQPRFGGPAAGSQPVSKQELPYLDIPAQPARRRASTYQMAAGAGAAAGGVGMLNAARKYTNTRATSRAASAWDAAKGPQEATRAAAARMNARVADDARGSTSRTRRQARRATNDYRASLARSSSAVNAAVAADNFAATSGKHAGGAGKHAKTKSIMPGVARRRLALAGGGAALVTGGFLMARSGARRRQEGN